MKKIQLAALIVLLLALAFPNIPKVSSTSQERPFTPALPDVHQEPMPEGYTTKDYLNTTNPYSQINPLGEETDEEGSHPLYVLVFVDEEERQIIRGDEYVSYTWDEWARWQLERGDEALVASFGIDIRILGFEEWDSGDSIEYMTDLDEWDLCDELLADKGQYLRTWYNGEWWSNYVDAIIGITAQATPGDPVPVAGVAPSDEEMDERIIFLLLKWQVHWMDDNLVQHEVSHLYDAEDDPRPQPPAPCCAMAYHPHYQSWIWENGLWWVFKDVACAFTSYYWCSDCDSVIWDNRMRYPLRNLTISVPYGHGDTDPAPGTYIYFGGESVEVRAYPDEYYRFSYWMYDDYQFSPDNPVTMTMDSDHTLRCQFVQEGSGGPPGGGGGNPLGGTPER